MSTWAVAKDDVRLVAYVVTANDSLDPTELREALRARLPDYMLPQHVARLQQLPRPPNGKVDRSRLPAPDQSERPQTGASRQRDQQALTPQEQAITAIWADVLGIGNIGRSDNFFDLGRHSLLAMRAVAAIEQKSGHTQAFIGNPTPRSQPCWKQAVHQPSTSTGLLTDASCSQILSNTCVSV